MVEVAQSIDLKLSEKLRDRNYRKKFFLAEASAKIAAQLIALRKNRGLNQTELAERIGTKQPAISRVEGADYHSWSHKTLRAIADELDARITVLIQPSEEVLNEYEQRGDVDVANTKTSEASVHGAATLPPTYPFTAPALTYGQPNSIGGMVTSDEIAQALRLNATVISAANSVVLAGVCETVRGPNAVTLRAGEAANKGAPWLTLIGQFGSCVSAVTSTKESDLLGIIATQEKIIADLRRAGSSGGNVWWPNQARGAPPFVFSELVGDEHEGVES